MKSISALSMAAILSMPAIAFAQSSAHQGMDMKGMNMKQCSEMKGMDMKQCPGMMNGAGTQAGPQGAQEKPQAAGPHRTTAVVKAVDPNKGTVTLAHQAIASLKWPAMTMSFAVKDRSLLDKLTVGRTVNVELTKQGANYVVTAVD